MNDFSADFAALEEVDFSIGGKTNQEPFEKMNYLGGSKQSWPIDVRILVNPISKDEMKPSIESSFHEYIVNDQYVRIPCARSVEEVCPICDAYWEHYEVAKKMEVMGASSEEHPKHAEWKRHKTLEKQFKQQKRFSMLVVLRGDNKVSILETKPQLTKAIFGDRYKQKAGAISEIKSYGVPVFNPAESTGWLTLNKTGEKLNTTYTAKPATHIKIDGRKKSEELVEEALHPQVLEKFQNPDKLPKLFASFKSRVWSREELENFVASDGTQLPAREQERLAKKRKYNGKGEEAPAVAKSETVDFDDPDSFDPF
jgi:hypothetical protein